MRNEDFQMVAPQGLLEGGMRRSLPSGRQEKAPVGGNPGNGDVQAVDQPKRATTGEASLAGEGRQAALQGATKVKLSAFVRKRIANT